MLPLEAHQRRMFKRWKQGCEGEIRRKTAKGLGVMDDDPISAPDPR